jgi:hypothetical protein
MIVIVYYKDKEHEKHQCKGSITMNIFNLIQAFMNLAFLIILCLYMCICNNFHACKFVCIKCKCFCNLRSICTLRFCLHVIVVDKLF